MTTAVGPESLWLWIGTIGMTLGTLYFVGRGRGVRDAKMQEFYIITIFITSIAAVNYFAMATGFGVTDVMVGDEALTIYWARYTDWLFTTPLLLLDLSLLAGANRNTIATLIGLDVFMIGTGAIATFASTPATRIAWWGISTGALLVLLYVLVGTLSEKARSKSAEVASLFGTLRNLVIVLWLLYPVVWILGTEGTFGILPLYWETAAFMVLDLSAKVGFGVVLLRSRSVLESAVTPTAAPS
ncbi:rhodopsin [Halobiforma lacisalsi AJ5]|uniref:Rhodopsin n=3 Tax=Natronobacterium TaxID=2256 RepID=A0A1P8LP89_NATLA|nr:bacteriorhodopsin [Halobiforma lacisalsi]APW97592.1 rhodopsin [Halobiforma lacisalsi AJ5]APW97594.1 rhodopsin [Halobiforma lacisalsi AJ5]